MQLAHALPGHSADRVGNVVQFPSDEALLRLIAGGARGAIEILFKRHRVRVFRFALSITRDRALAEEIVSDVFLDIWRGAGSFRGKSQVSTWFLAITRHKALSSLRRHARQQSNEQLSETLEDPADNAEAAMQKRQTGMILADGLRRLSTSHREIIDLVYYHRKSIEEAAELLKVSKNTVKTRMFHARKRLAEILAVKTDAKIPSLS